MCCRTKFHKPDCLCFKVHVTSELARLWKCMVRPCIWEESKRTASTDPAAEPTQSLHKPHADHGMQLLQPAAATVYRNTLQCAGWLHQSILHLFLKVSAADCSIPLIYLSFQGMKHSCSSAVFLGLSWHTVQRSLNTIFPHPQPLGLEVCQAEAKW